MELLLAFLSLLTAATGALTGARAPEAELQQPAQIGIVATVTAKAIVVVQAIAAPRSAVLGVAPPVSPSSGQFFAVASPVPLYANRLIE